MKPETQALKDKLPVEQMLKRGTQKQKAVSQPDLVRASEFMNIKEILEIQQKTFESVLASQNQIFQSAQDNMVKAFKEVVSEIIGATNNPPAPATTATPEIEASDSIAKAITGGGAGSGFRQTRAQIDPDLEKAIVRQRSERQKSITWKGQNTSSANQSNK